MEKKKNPKRWCNWNFLMSNYGLQNYFKKKKIKFIRANVGDRYVKEKMQK